MNKQLTAVFSAVFLLLIVGVNPAGTKAQTVDLSVSPTFLDYNLKPGDTKTDKIRLRNNSTAPINISLSVNQLVADEQGRIIPEEAAFTDWNRWFRFTNTSITVPDREWIDIPFTITVPSDAVFGNYFALVISPQVSKAPDSTTSIQGNTLVPVLIKTQTPGSLAQANISSFTSSGFLHEYLPVNFTVRVNNTGNIHLKPRGNLFIRDSSGKDLAFLEVNQAQGNILPSSFRDFTASWSDGFIVKTDTGIKFNWNKLTDFRIGKYTAYVLLAYDDGGRDVPIDATLVFWVFPYTPVIITLIVAVTLFVVISRGFKAMVKREARRLRN